MTSGHNMPMQSQNMTGQPDGNGETPPSGVEELRQEIEQTRGELGETVEALAQKADVKTQARNKITEGKQALRHKASELGQKVQSATPDRAQQIVGQAIAETRQRPLSVGTAFLLGFLLGLILKKRR